VQHSYFSVRGGLPHLAQRLRNGPVTVAYVGGSLTAMKEGWRPMIHNWFDVQFPAGQRHRCLHVGRGGVGSASGAFFVQDEVCGHDPDLVFIEYAINDSYPFLTPPELLIPSVEGMVRAVRNRHPRCEFCFIYTTHTLRRMEIEPVVAVYEQIAEHYGIPSINAGHYFTDLVAAKQWSWQGQEGIPALLRDECHPTPMGNQVLASLILTSLSAFLAQPQPRSEAPSEPIAPHAFSRGRVLPVTPAMIAGDFVRKHGLVGNCPAEVHWLSLPEGSELSFQGDGALIGLYLVIGPESGIIRCSMGTRQVERTLFDRWCYYDRISTCMLIESTQDLAPLGERISIRLSSRRPDYTVCPKLVNIPAQMNLNLVALFVN
jgi:lysophospholipase L1-like esterase